MCFLGVLCVFFWCLEERKMCRETRQREKFKKMCSSLICGVSGAIYSLDMLFKVVALGGSPALTSFDRVDPNTFGKVLTSCF